MGCIEMTQQKKRSQGWNVLLAAFSLGLAMLANAAWASSDYCHRETYARAAAGKVPHVCADSRHVIEAGLCYQKCRDGMVGVGPLCLSTCEAGWKDAGLTCFPPSQPAPYGVGAGYPWKIGDPPGNYERAGVRCNQENTGVGCTKEGLIWYPNCKTGYRKAGALICEAEPPKCKNSGLTAGPLGCEKSSPARPVGVVPSACSPDEQLNAGLCYAVCKPGFTAIGNNCAQTCPAATPYACNNIAGVCAATAGQCSHARAEPLANVLTLLGRNLEPLGTLTADETTAIRKAVDVAINAWNKQAVDKGLATLVANLTSATGVKLTDAEATNLVNALSGDTYNALTFDARKLQAIGGKFSKPMCKA
jgi:hypothetical protein